MGADEEPNRLRALLALMREFGATRVVTPDGFTLERPAPSPLEAAIAAEKQAAAVAASKGDDVDEDLEAEEAEEKTLIARWNEHWRRLTLSSGAGTPAFPGRDKALRILGHS